MQIENQKDRKSGLTTGTKRSPLAFVHQSKRKVNKRLRIKKKKERTRLRERRMDKKKKKEITECTSD